MQALNNQGKLELCRKISEKNIDMNSVKYSLSLGKR
jgi:hypothetical protein